MTAMKQQCVGIIGGMSWESTLLYYKKANQQIAARLGGMHSADLLIHSLDFATICDWQHRGQWDKLDKLMADTACRLEAAGASAVAIATNTMHRCAPAVTSAISVPLINLISNTASVCINAKHKHVGLLGTRFTMEADFYRGELQNRGLTVTVPTKNEREDIHRIIYDELCQGQVTSVAKQRFLAIMHSLAAQGVTGFILGCTEIGLLINNDDVPFRLFDTTDIHVEAIVRHLVSSSGS